MTEKTDIRDSDEKVVEIEMERLKTFTNHPFKVIGDSQMIELQDSIKKYASITESTLLTIPFLMSRAGQRERKHRS